MSFVYFGILFSSVFIYLFFPLKIAVAANFTFDQSPKPVKSDDGSVIIAAHYQDSGDIFVDGLVYTVKVFQKAGNRDCVPSGTTVNQQSVVKVKRIDGRNLEASWDLKGCRGTPGDWTFQICLGQGTIACDSAGNILGEYSFQIDQAGGELPDIKPVNDKVQFGKTPEVLLLNARENNTYTFWWDGDFKDLAADPFKAPQNGNFPIKLTYGGGNIKAGEKKKLCMEIGDYRVPLGLTCRKGAIFEFTLGDPGTSGEKCELIPKIPKTRGSISILGRGLNNNERYAAVLFVESTEIRRVDGIADSTGNVSINLVTGLAKNSYRAILSDQSNRNICDIPFTISEDGDGTASQALDCSKEPDKCSRAAGQFCDEPNNTKLRTAIGCIPTEPGALINGLLKFSIAAAGGIALLLMIWGSIEMMVSGGDAKTLGAGRERFVSALIGLIFVVFSVVLLKIIGVDILDLPSLTDAVKRPS